METENPNDGHFEISMRVLSNEIFAVKIAAEPLSKRWVNGALLITITTVVALSLFGEPLYKFSQRVYSSADTVQLD
jgi:hypothetical protein